MTVQKGLVCFILMMSHDGTLSNDGHLSRPDPDQLIH